MPRKEYRKKIPIEKTRRGSLWTGSCWSLYERNRAVVLIGEDHQGHWTNTPEALKDVEEVVN